MRARGRGCRVLAPGALLALLVGGCAGGPGTPVADRQDPVRFERCADPEGQASYEQAIVELQAGRDRQAIPLLREVVVACPELVPAHILYQDLATAMGGEELAAMRAFYRSQPDAGDSPVPQFAKARLLQSDYARKSALDALVEDYPDFAFAYLSLGRLHRGVGRYADAASSFQRAIDWHPNLAAAQVELAEALVELGRFAEAELPYQNYLAREPHDRDSIRAFVNLLLYKLKRPEVARPWIEQLLAADPGDERARMDLAAADWLSGRYQLALENYLEVLSQQPDNARVLLNIGHLYYDGLPADEAERRVYWAKARKAYLLYQQWIRPEEGLDHFEAQLAVPYRLKRIAELLGPDDGAPPTLDDLRD